MLSVVTSCSDRHQIRKLRKRLNMDRRPNFYITHIYIYIYIYTLKKKKKSQRIYTDLKNGPGRPQNSGCPPKGGEISCLSGFIWLSPVSRVTYFIPGVPTGTRVATNTLRKETLDRRFEITFSLSAGFQ